VVDARLPRAGSPNATPACHLRSQGRSPPNHSHETRTRLTNGAPCQKPWTVAILPFVEHLMPRIAPPHSFISVLPFSSSFSARRSPKGCCFLRSGWQQYCPCSSKVRRTTGPAPREESQKGGAPSHQTLSRNRRCRASVVGPRSCTHASPPPRRGDAS